MLTHAIIVLWWKNKSTLDVKKVKKQLFFHEKVIFGKKDKSRFPTCSVDSKKFVIRCSRKRKRRKKFKKSEKKRSEEENVRLRKESFFVVSVFATILTLLSPLPLSTFPKEN